MRSCPKRANVADSVENQTTTSNLVSIKQEFVSPENDFRSPGKDCSRIASRGRFRDSQCNRVGSIARLKKRHKKEAPPQRLAMTPGRLPNSSSRAIVCVPFRTLRPERMFYIRTRALGCPPNFSDNTEKLLLSGNLLRPNCTGLHVVSHAGSAPNDDTERCRTVRHTNREHRSSHHSPVIVERMTDGQKNQ